MDKLLKLALVTSALALMCNAKQYLPNWESLDSRPLPEWYDEVKFGIFICLGVYSVPSYESEWFWFNWKGRNDPKIAEFMANNYRPNYTYADFASYLSLELFDADAWADVLAASRAKYIVFTTKHHSGYTLWPSKYSFNWNSQDVGPRRDVVGELASSLRSRTDMRLGLYHSLFEWFHPLYLQDKANHYNTQKFVQQKTLPELYELVNTYKPEVVWSDGDWEAPDSYWNSTHFLAWLYNESPVKDSVVTNDRWGKGVTCHHGDFYTCQDRYNPGKLQPNKWENAMTIDRKSWGFRRDMTLQDVLTTPDLIAQLVSTVSCGGNLLMNINPTSDGRITPIFEERLREMGQWLDVNGDAIFKTIPWKHQKDSISPHVWYTAKKPGKTMLKESIDTVYAILLDWPQNGNLTLGFSDGDVVKDVRMLGDNDGLNFSYVKQSGLVVDLTKSSFSKLPCKWAWVLEITIMP